MVLGVPIMLFPRLVQTNPASNVAGMLMNRQTGLFRWLSRDWVMSARSSSESVAWSLGRARWRTGEWCAGWS